MSMNDRVPTHSGYPDFLIVGRECECDLDARCDNHDIEAESAYWRARVTPAANMSAYPPDPEPMPWVA